MSQPPLVSIIINNYNYGRFLRQAIDSALRQAYRPVEVVVVDDGSTDDSRSVIAACGREIIPVFKENGGQASAFNAGFRSSHGEIIIFLDADDLLLPEVVQHVVQVSQVRPGVAKIQYRLEVIGACGERTGQVRPPWDKAMPGGDLRAQVLTFPDDIPWQPTSGNAFPAWVLRQIFPVPEEIYPICADYYLSNLPPLFGEVVSLDEVGGFYRVHGANNHHSSGFDLEQTRQIITRTIHTHRYIRTFAGALDLPGFPPEPGPVMAVTFLAHRLVSRKLDPGRHPVQADRVLPLGVQGARAALGRFDLSWAARIPYLLWFGAATVAPKPVVRWLARQFFTPAPAGVFTRFTRSIKGTGRLSL